MNTAQARAPANRRPPRQEVSPSPAAAPSFLHRRRNLLLGLALVSATIIAYLPVLRSGGFVWDDDLHILNNIITRPRGLWRTWFSVEQPNYWPVTWTAFWAEWQLFGRNPAGYHAVNVAVHAANCILLWSVLAALALPGAWLAALLFAVHPVNVETAAWITQLKTLLSMLFMLGSVRAWLAFDTRTGRERAVLYSLSLVLFLVGMLAKPAIVTLPVVLLGIALWKRGRITRTDLVRAAPFFLVAGALSLTEIWFQYTRSIAGAEVRSDSFPARLAGAGWVAGFYLKTALAPASLATIYPRWNVNPLSLYAWIPNLLLAGAAAAAWIRRGTWGRPVLFGLGYFILTLAPVLGFLNIYYMRYSFVADHYQYASIPGVITLVTGVAVWLVHNRFPRLKPAAVAAAGAGVLVFTGYAWYLQRDYRDEETFYRRALLKNPDAYLARNNLGNLLLRRGDLDEAARQFEEARKLQPDYAEPYANLGAVLAARGRTGEAMPFFRKASELTGDLFEPHNRLGETYLRYGQVEEAAAEFNKAIALEPRCASAHDNLGVIALWQGRLPEALQHFGRAIHHAPRFAAAREHLAEARLRLGDEQGAFAAYREAIEAIPEAPELRNNLAATLAASGRLDEAIEQLREAARVAPEFAPTHKNLGALLARRGEREQAARHLHRALALDPSDREAAAVLRQITGNKDI